jgi:hypothetical protein
MLLLLDLLLLALFQLQLSKPGIARPATQAQGTAVLLWKEDHNMLSTDQLVKLQASTIEELSHKFEMMSGQTDDQLAKCYNLAIRVDALLGGSSFPIHFTNNLPMMFPKETKHCLFRYDLAKEDIFLGIIDDINNNLSGPWPREKTYSVVFKFVPIGMRWLQKLMKPHYPHNKTTHEDNTNLSQNVTDTKCSPPHIPVGPHTVLPAI